MKILAILFLILLSLSTNAQLQYGVIENTELTSAQSINIKKASVALITTEKLLSKNLMKMNELYRFCSVERFVEQRLWSKCSGTLISKNTVLTAGHCALSNADCNEMNFVFDFNSDTDIEKIQLDSKKIYKCKKILFNSKPVPSTQLKDYALIQLDRDVTDRAPISLGTAALVKTEDIISVGFPLGLPLKISKGFVDQSDANWNLADTQIEYYKSHLIAHFGLSGGGVYNSNYDLVGVLVRGDTGMEADDGRCMRIRTCESGDCPWAEVQKIEIENIKKYLK